MPQNSPEGADLLRSLQRVELLCVEILREVRLAVYKIRFVHQLLVPCLARRECQRGNLPGAVDPADAENAGTVSNAMSRLHQAFAIPLQKPRLNTFSIFEGRRQRWSCFEHPLRLWEHPSQR